MARTAKQKFARRVLWELIGSLVIGGALGAFMAYYDCTEDLGTIVTAVTIGTFISFVIIDYMVVYLNEKMNKENTDLRYPGYYIIHYNWRSTKFVLKFILWLLLYIIVGAVLIIIVDVSIWPAIIYFGITIIGIIQYIWDNYIKKKFDNLED
jgi:FtsH-binding integral membrane protein